MAVHCCCRVVRVLINIKHIFLQFCVPFSLRFSLLQYFCFLINLLTYISTRLWQVWLKYFAYTLLSDFEIGIGDNFDPRSIYPHLFHFVN